MLTAFFSPGKSSGLFLSTEDSCQNYPLKYENSTIIYKELEHDPPFKYNQTIWFTDIVS